MLLHLTEYSGEPLHHQISQQLLASILAGSLQAGAELQPARSLARKHRVSVNNVEQAYQDLAREGLLSYDSDRRVLVNALSLEQKQRLVLQSFFADAQERQRMEEELSMARNIQAGLLPKTLPKNARLQMAASCESARAIGGDFYDYLPLDAHRFALVIADACGKGMPAAMVISPLQAIIKSETSHGSSIQQIMPNLNQYVKRFASTKSFATLVYGVFDDRTGSFEFANAGHHPPMLVRQNGQIEFLKTTGPALGLLAEAEHQIARTKLNTGDCLLFYTDGVTETMNPAREEYGEPRLQDLLIRHRECGAQEIIDYIIDDLNTFRASALLQDDRTIMALKVLVEA
jgi:sigma-B regulation protein RsbU (phosphoserine phosphatase)